MRALYTFSKYEWTGPATLQELSKHLLSENKCVDEVGSPAAKSGKQELV